VIFTKRSSVFASMDGCYSEEKTYNLIRMTLYKSLNALPCNRKINVSFSTLCVFREAFQFPS